MVVDEAADRWDLIVAKEVLVEIDLADVRAARERRDDTLQTQNASEQ